MDVKEWAKQRRIERRDRKNRGEPEPAEIVVSSAEYAAIFDQITSQNRQIGADPPTGEITVGGIPIRKAP